MATTQNAQGSEIIQTWPDESREAAQLVIDKYGEPHEATDSYLVWHGVGQYKRVVASKTFREPRSRLRTSTRSRESSTTASPPSSSRRSPGSTAASSPSGRRARSPRAATTRRRTTLR